MATKKVTKKEVKETNSVIKGARITEKGAMGVDKGFYTFNVATTANKSEIKKAIKALYKVDTVKINIIKIPKKNVIVRGRAGVKSGGKKAVVFLKKGDKIEFA